MLKKAHICYTYGSVEMEGLLIFEEHASAPGPGVLVLHEYPGIDDHIMKIITGHEIQRHSVLTPVPGGFVETERKNRKDLSP